MYDAVTSVSKDFIPQFIRLSRRLKTVISHHITLTI